MRIFSIVLAAVALPFIAAGQSHWIGSWGASPSPQLADAAQMSSQGLIFSNQTVREIVHVSAGGSSVRVRLSNAYGKMPVQIAAVHIARRTSGSAIDASSDRAVTFSGQASVMIPTDALVLSDPVPFDLAANSDIAVSLYLAKPAVGAGIHYAAQQTNYVGAGDRTAAAEIGGGATIKSWVFLTGVDVLAPESGFTVVMFGDSITDGARSTENANHRWPNFFAERLPNAGVLDEGIGGNRILHDPNSNIAFGVNALARFDRDVLAQPGVKYVIVLEGINDLGHAGPNLFPNEQVGAPEIIAGLAQLAARAHEKGIKIYGATLTPFIGTPFPGYYSDEKEASRKAVNEWIRTSHAFDGVVDFEKAVEDPAHPGHIRPEFDSGDHLHPKDEGYKAMAEAIDLGLFQ
jgi:lysophospholipase L1-like esterase